MENSMEIPQKFKISTTTWPSYSTSGHLPKEHKNAKPKKYTHPCVHCSITYNSQDMGKKPKCPSMHEWIKM